MLTLIRKIPLLASVGESVTNVVQSWISCVLFLIIVSQKVNAPIIQKCSYRVQLSWTDRIFGVEGQQVFNQRTEHLVELRATLISRKLTSDRTWGHDSPESCKAGEQFEVKEFLIPPRWLPVRKKSIFHRGRQTFNFGSLLSLRSALGFIWQHVDSLRCANPFDAGWIDSCWQNALCHFVCCHLIGAPQFPFPPRLFFPPVLTVARFCLTSKVRLCPPFQEFKTD